MFDYHSQKSAAEARQRRAEQDAALVIFQEQSDRKAALRAKAEKAAQEAMLAEAEAKRRAAAKVELDAYRSRMLRAWQDDGGTEAEFDRQWPSIKAQYLTQRAGAKQDAGRRDFAEWIRQNASGLRTDPSATSAPAITPTE